MSLRNLFLGLGATLTLIACGGGGGTAAVTPPPLPNPSAPTDADGYTYRTVTLGKQVWLAENLRATHAVGGAAVPGIYAYNLNEAHVAAHGRLYTWEAARAAYLPGWRLPTFEDWSTLIQTVGSPQTAQKLLEGGSTGFNATFSGYRDYGGGFREQGTWSAYWTATLMDVTPQDHAHVVHLYRDKPEVEREGVGIIGALTVRLVKDAN